MAGIGLYGVYYAKCVKENGVVSGYEGSPKLIGKAVGANFEPKVPEENPLYANNAVAENDISSGAGGRLTATVDRITLETAADLFGTTVQSVQVSVSGDSVEGKEITYKGNETSTPVGAAYIELHQEDGKRIHEVVFYREVTFARPNKDPETMTDTIAWKTPELSATVSGMQGDGSQPWYRLSRWPTQEAAIAYIYQLFGAEASAAQINDDMEQLNAGEDEVGV